MLANCCDIRGIIYFVNWTRFWFCFLFISVLNVNFRIYKYLFFPSMLWKWGDVCVHSDDVEMKQSGSSNGFVSVYEVGNAFKCQTWFCVLRPLRSCSWCGFHFTPVILDFHQGLLNIRGMTHAYTSYTRIPAWPCKRDQLSLVTQRSWLAAFITLSFSVLAVRWGPESTRLIAWTNTVFVLQSPTLRVHSGGRCLL